MVVAIIVPIHNRIEITKTGLLSLENNLKIYREKVHDDDFNFEIVVIDDGSTDGSADWISANYPEIVLLKGDGNLWWTGAVNLGARYSCENLKADFILLWNDDIITDESYFLNLRSVIMHDTNRETIYGSYIYEFPRKEKIWSRGGHFDKYFGLRRMYKDRWLDKNVKKIYWFTGMGTIIPAEILMALNYFDDKNFQHYYGDTDFTLRAFELGYKLKCSAELKIWNKIEHSNRIASDTWKDYFNSLKLTQSKHNLKKEVSFLRKHTVTPFWVIYFFIKQFTHLLHFLSNKYIKGDSK